MKGKIFRVLYSSLLLWSMVALGGCVSTSLSQRFAFDDKPESGVLFASMTYFGQTGFSIAYRNVGDPEIKGKLLVDDLVGSPLSFESSDFDGARGKIVAVELSPGDYEFYSWGVRSGFLRLGASSPFSIKVRVSRGAATYAGEFQMVPVGKLGAMVSSAEVHFEEKIRRDGSIFLEKYPGIGADSLYTGIPESISIRNLGSGASADFDFVSILLPALMIAPILD